jgi:hypothetical protein
MGEGVLDSQRPGQVKAAWKGDRSFGTLFAVQWQVLQEPEEQLLQLEEEALMRLDPPPMPNPEMSFRTSPDPH